MLKSGSEAECFCYNNYEDVTCYMEHHTLLYQSIVEKEIYFTNNLNNEITACLKNKKLKMHAMALF